ncbi:conserved hypothetical protein [Paraburkholderia piptadeniae]|uniref:Anti-sigma K factor RskA C-terminal domain-containing protein n=1 Tax=Paraburkholderia piptadeniae TaxID=1701573 RepID=A0A1N7RPR0_9BURK|nr:anti-sigma factor [Paraburkholderia piptadeniae]SIT37098.1 conserved hypothetical protein [Paraburkholderia piptadeniae]
MSTSFDHDDDELRCAEYALGLLDVAERGEVEAAMRRDPRLAARVARWQQHLAPLAEDIGEIAPPARVWNRVRSDLGFVTPVHAEPRARWWDSLPFWRWIGIGASLAAASLLTVTVVSIRQSSVTTVAGEYLVANIAPSGGIARWTATVDLRSARVVVVPASVTAVAAGRSTELWLIPPGAKAISLGVIASDQPTTVALPRDVLARMTTQAVLAVSLEPRGGSPTGQPTGPILATGAVRGT